MKLKTSFLPAIPLAALLMTNCVTEGPGEADAGAAPEPALAAYVQSALPFNASQFTSLNGDFNGDGKKDLFFIGSDGGIHVRLSDGSTLGSIRNLLSAGAFGSPAGGKYLLGDMNADGKSDLFFIGNSGDVHVRISNGSDYYTYRQLLHAGDFGNWYIGQYLMGDVNGDRKTDLYFIGNGGDLHLIRSNGTTFDSYRICYGPNAFGTLAGGKYLLGDMDGDGPSDLYFIGNGGDIHVRLSNGYTYPSAMQLFGANASQNWSTGQFLIGQVAGDAKDDLLYIDNSGWSASSRSLGSTHEQFITVFSSDAYGTIHDGQYYLGDFNGDSDKDLFFISNGGAVYVRPSTGWVFDYQLDLIPAGEYGTLTTGIFM